MTAGITGVFWLPRMAEMNSTLLNAGAHAVPISAAATAWGGLTAAWLDATATVTRVVAELGVGMQGVNGVAALSRLVGFTGWAEQQSAMATTMASKAASNATAYTVASLAMPSLPEIVATNGAVVASANPPGAVSGALEAAEVTKNAMDVRAAMVMETYEAATSAMVLTPGEFNNPPPIANGAGTAEATESPDTAFQGDPVQAAIGAAVSAINNPAVVSAATQVANVAGTVATGGVSTVGNIGATAIAAATSMPAPAVAGTAAAPMMMGVGAVGAGASASAITRSASAGGVSVNVNGGSLKLPEGWGSGATIGSSPAAAPVAESAVARVEAAPVRSAASTSSSPLLGNARAEQDDEHEHKGGDYLHGDHFNDGRYAAEGVIGAQPSGSAK
ncbi:PPE domain-containing protein [Nocardia bovistercoris]|uniref:PPE family protein n=1 Tax=Nocardia bovistercoris TaxID=2785916 RepID=A0A931ICM6_9NOCA|nr:PPE domain-containing protein [Nocardia bovistercoris]MBH0778959.1 PPE family protein [Nocardia bovistercoris]